MFDPLTGLFNRRFAEERLKSEIARSERQGLALILVLLGAKGEASRCGFARNFDLLVQDEHSEALV